MAFRTPPSVRLHDELLRWRREVRPRALRRIAARAEELRWSFNLLLLVLEELRDDETVLKLVGPLEELPASRYPQAIAVAVALRHSWRPDDLARVVRRLRLPRVASLRLRQPAATVLDARQATKVKGRRV